MRPRLDNIPMDDWPDDAIAYAVANTRKAQEVEAGEMSPLELRVVEELERRRAVVIHRRGSTFYIRPWGNLRGYLQ